MSEVTAELQTAVVQRLRNDAGVAALVNGRVFDQVPRPTQTPFPYITYGPDPAIQDDVTCITAYDVSMQIDVWSRDVGKMQMKRIVGAVRDALHNAEFDIGSDYGLVSMQHINTTPLGDPDGLTSHGAMTFRALIDAL